MRHAITLLAIALLGLGAYFLGNGITGHVTSQTCCLPPNCAEEYLCSAAGQHAREEVARLDARLGLLMVFAAVATFVTHELAIRE